MRLFAIALLTLSALAIAGLLPAVNRSTIPESKSLDPFTLQMKKAIADQSASSPQAITAATVNGVVNPVLYPGSDIGEKINNVFAVGDGCAEV